MLGCGTAIWGQLEGSLSAAKGSSVLGLYEARFKAYLTKMWDQ